MLHVSFPRIVVAFLALQLVSFAVLRSKVFCLPPKLLLSFTVSVFNDNDSTCVLPFSGIAPLFALDCSIRTVNRRLTSSGEPCFAVPPSRLRTNRIKRSLLLIQPPILQ